MTRDGSPFVLLVMSRLQTFLPEIETANRQLSEQVSIDPKQVNIENVDEDGQYIEMVGGFICMHFQHVSSVQVIKIHWF